MRREVPPLFAAGFALAVMELAWVLARGRGLFLSLAEQATYASVAFTFLPAVVAVVGLALRPALLADRRAELFRRAYAVLAVAVATVFAFFLTEGRRVRDLPMRPLMIAGVALGVGLFVLFSLARAALIRGSLSRRAHVLWSLACAGTALAALAVDALVLPRSYPAFHVALTALAVFAAALGGSVWHAAWRLRPLLWVEALAVVALLSSPWLAIRLSAQPNASYVVREVAPWTGKWMRAWSRASERRGPHTRSERATSANVAETRRGIDLRDRDVLLVTVDALRADVLRAYGGKGLTPELDHLASESVVFRRAYTPAPHTSYALASLLTAKFMKPVLELPGASADHPTLPDVLRRYGYRTAAFYPPAIFFVDGSRFEALHARGFGFEYRKEMYAKAGERVAQVQQYLDEAEPGHPLFVWVHMFEPHEPYDPPPELVRDDSARGRYEAEVAVCDRAIGELVRMFRARKPSATVIVSADHGEEFGDHGGHYHGTTLYDEQVRIPLLWSSPGVVTPSAVDVPVELVDVGTTLLSAFGIPRDARMRGDDLGAVLAGEAQAGPRYAFASVEDKNLVTDGRLKVTCARSDAHCQLFDVVADPTERRNAAEQRASEVAQLRSELDAFLSSIPRVEALALTDGVGFPEALARARLGSPGAGRDVVPLLGDARAPIRALAARALGELGVQAALPMLERLRANDPDPDVRAESSIAALMLGVDAAAAEVVALLASTQAAHEGLSQAQRAALALARVKRVESVPVLSALALDERAQESERLRAIAALGEVESVKGADSLIQLLQDVRLRSPVSDALARIGGRRAIAALSKQLAEERYPPARRAEANALVVLGDKRVQRQIERFLGMETSIPDGVRMLLALRAFEVPSARGAKLTVGSVRKGTWECSDAGCTPGTDAKLVLPLRGSSAVRITLLVTEAEPGSTLTVDGEPLAIKASEDQLSFMRTSARRAQELSLALVGKGRVVAVAVVPVSAEIPAPPPEPWEPGEADAGVAPIPGQL